MKQYKYLNKDKNLIILINGEKNYTEDPMYAFQDFETHLPTLVFKTDEMIYDYEGNFKYFYKEKLVQETDEKSELINEIIDSIDVFIEKKKIRDENKKENLIIEILPEITVNTLNK